LFAPIVVDTKAMFSTMDPLLLEKDIVLILQALTLKLKRKTKTIKLISLFCIFAPSKKMNL